MRIRFFAKSIAIVTGALAMAGVMASKSVLKKESHSSGSADRSTVPIRKSSVVVLPPVVDVQSVNTDSGVVERSLCVTVGLGASSAAECGDLRIAHALASVRTMNRTRTPVLIYNSAHAQPFPIVRANVTVGSGNAGLTRVSASLFVEGRLRASVSVPGSAWPNGKSRIALGYDASKDPSGFYRYELVVRNVYGASADSTTARGQLVVVNRTTSPFGAGWWLAGLERLLTDGRGNPVFWIGGDGSTRRYFGAGAGKWVAARVDRPDTILRVGSRYVRLLPGEDSVFFDLAGRHVATKNRLGHQTSFTYRYERLDSLILPTPSISVRRAYAFVYDSVGRLKRVDAAGSTPGSVRSTNLSRTGATLTITDPDTTAVVYTTGSADNRIVKLVGRHADTLDFRFGAGGKVVAAKLNLEAGDSSVTRLRSVEAVGILGGGGVGVVDSAHAYSWWDAPRQDVGDSTRFFVNRYGSPITILDPLGRTTSIAYGDALYPAVVARVTYPNSRIAIVNWSARGNLQEVRDSTQHLTNGLATSVMRYTYNSANARDLPDSIIDPENVVTRFSYTSQGWPSSITAPNGHVTSFAYKTAGLAGLLASVTEQNVPVLNTATTETIASVSTGFAYDSLGNQSADTSALGYVRRMEGDGIGRVQNFYDAMGHRTQYLYDAMDRMVEVIRHPIAADSPFTALSSKYFYVGGLLDHVLDPRNVRRDFRYNAFGLVTQEIDDYGAAERRFYNRAGQVDSVRPRYFLGTSKIVRNTYDAGGRLTRTFWSARDSTLADSVMYTYTQTDQIESAVNTSYRVDREYFANGLLKREYQATPANTFRATNEYAYDKAGRRVWYRLGNPAVERDSVWYRYDTATGELRTIGVRWRDNARDSVLFRWDALGRRDTLIYANHPATPLKVTFAYDKDGRFRRLCAQNAFGTVTPDVFDFRASIDSIEGDGVVRKHSVGTDAACPSSVTASAVTDDYDSRHRLLRQVTGGTDTTYYRYDESDNMVVWKQPVQQRDRRFEIAAGHNRIDRFWKSLTANPSYTVKVFYDSSGGRIDEAPYVGAAFDSTKGSRRKYWYDGLGRLTGTGQYFYQSNWVGDQFVAFADTVHESLYQWVANGKACRYGPLGQLWVPCDNGAPRLIYDGENVVRTGTDSADASIPRFTIVHGPGTDDPLMARRPGSATGGTLFLYWVTDGEGRQYAVGSMDGTDQSAQINYQNEGKYAGSIASARTFENQRFQSPNQNALSSYRNRYYDRETGRWIQEDPLGISAGLNTYAFVGNNPGTYMDPFGLTAGDPQCSGLLSCVVRFLSNQWRGFSTPLDQGPPAGGSAGYALSRWLLPMGTSATAAGFGAAAAASEGRALAEMSGMLRAASAGKGNFGIGSATAEVADEIGHAWVGQGYTVASDGRTLVSANGLRQYRPGSFKPNWGREQANLEWRLKPEDAWQGNAHINIITRYY